MQTMANDHMTPFQKIAQASKTTGLSQYYLRRGCRDGSTPWGCLIPAGDRCGGTLSNRNAPAKNFFLGGPRTQTRTGQGFAGQMFLLIF